MNTAIKGPVRTIPKTNEVKAGGLTAEEVSEKKSLGLSNEIIDSYNSSYPSIFVRNILSLVNLVLLPLMIALAYFELYREIFAFSTFLFINTIVSIADEVRIKRKIDKLKSEFQQTARVIRDGEEQIIPTNEVVQGDYILVKEGEGVIADGEIIEENYLQVDESMLTGESNYHRREAKEKVLSGSYVVTGSCIYIVESIGKNNYLNKLGSEAVKIKEVRSPVQKAGDKLILFLVLASIFGAGLNFYFAVIRGGATYPEGVLSVTAIVALIIPQTLIFLFTLTFTISISKLYSKGILVQKGGSIEDLANVDVICFDKTGTITTNKMEIIRKKFFNLEENDFGTFYNSVAEKLVGVNETQKLINKEFSALERIEITNFDQVPFTSKQKFSLIYGEVNNKKVIVSLGAISALINSISKDIRDELEKYLVDEESKGYRILLGLYKEFKPGEIYDVSKPLEFESNNAVIFTIEEELNPGIQEILNRLKDQKIAVKIISGDSKVSVGRICQKIGISLDEIADLSSPDVNITDLITTKSVFTRAKPEDKLTIINELKAKGFNVAMVGDGINDVLGLKSANVSISMESGAKITRDISDIVLLKNDYNKIPDVFFEGDNIIFNLKLSTKMFLVKSLFAFLITLYFSAVNKTLPMTAASILIFSFLGSSAPGYVLIFTRQKVKNTVSFINDVLRSSIPSSIIFAVLFILLYSQLVTKYSSHEIGTGLILFVLALSIIYSLYLVWEAKKLRNILLSIFTFILLMAAGIYETLLPVDLNDSVQSNLVLIGLMVLLGTGIAIALNILLKKKSLIVKLIAVLFSYIWIPIVCIFPFREYYSVTRIPLKIYESIAIFSIIGLVLIIIVNVAARKLGK